MKISHVLYKTKNLKDAVDKFSEMGFVVEYGSRRNPHNALIYFSEGPYIELIHKAPVPFYIKTILRIIGKGKVVDRFELWEIEKEGFFGLCLETHRTHFDKEELILKNHGQGFFKTKSKRTDPSNRVLKWKLLFPYELKLPFLMTYFNIDPKPKNFTHPNGVKNIKHITFGTDVDLIPIIKELCDDSRLELFVGDGVQRVDYGR